MSRRARFLAAGALVVGTGLGPAALGALASDGDPDAVAEVLLTFADASIDESSGLVVRDGRLFTVNDSGAGAEVFEVDPATGETVAVTTYASEDPEDVEALAPGRGGALWVGDIGDNRSTRGSVRVHRLTPPAGGGTVDAAAFDLVYPDRPHDAEALLVHPRTGRLLVVTKGFMRGGAVYVAPRRLVPGQTHELTRVGRVPGMVTDGAFLPGGDRLLLRTYGSATTYTWPELRPVADAELPAQEQGEAVAVGGDRMYLSSEGEHAEVLVTDLPRPAPDGGPPRAEPEDEPAPDRRGPAPSAEERDPQPWLGLGFWPFLGLATGVGLAAVGVRAALRRARRSR